MANYMYEELFMRLVLTLKSNSVLLCSACLGSPAIDSFHSGSIALLNSCTSPIVGMSKSYSNDCSKFVAQLQLPFVQETNST